MSAHPDYHKVAIGCCNAIAGIAIGMVVCFLISLCSCKAQRDVQFERIEVPIVTQQEHRVESSKIEHIRDTIVRRDSIYHYIKGDTTIIERWHYLTNTNVQVRTDTMRVLDSIPFPVEVVKERCVTRYEKVNELRWWQKFFISLGFGSLLLICGLMTKWIGDEMDW